MIKGHAVIELKDVATGEVQRVEHDNMITNGLKYCLTPWLGKFSYATDGNTPQAMENESTETRKNNNRSMMNHLLGGIFLFQNNLEENGENTAFPADNPLTGKASWDVYNGIDSCRGSYNENESGLQDDGSYKHVWDFSTNQANGQISALALTTYKGGICGDGFKDWNDTETTIKEAPFFEVGYIKISSNNTGPCMPFIKPSSNEVYYLKDFYNMDYNSAYASRHLGNTRKIIFEKKKIPLINLSPFYDYYNQYCTEEVEVEVPEEFAVYADSKSCAGKTSDEFLYIYCNFNAWNERIAVSPGQSFKFMRIRKSDLETDVVTLTNSTPYTIRMDMINFADNYCFVQTDNSPYFVYAIRITDNEVVEFERKKNVQTIRIGDYLYTEGDNKYSYCINMKTMSEKKHPLFNFANTNNLYGGIDKITQNIFLFFKNSNYRYDYGYSTADVYISTNTLMTINNLASPVVKTAAQTMKVTYTIQETEQ